MSDKKCDLTAEKWRSDGNVHFRDGEYLEALISYNKCLCYAEDGAMASLAYANRSAVYLEVKLYEKCLDNIEAARDSGYPKDKLHKLIDRAEKCKKLMKSHSEDPDDDPMSFFKLSHPPNDKIPYIVNCLEYRESDKFGRYIVTTAALRPGDIIAIEEPFYKVINKQFCDRRCTNCLKSNNLSLIPCESCTNSELKY